MALAYAAPDPTAPGVGIGDLGEFIYVGTATGQIYVTQDGGGAAQQLDQYLHRAGRLRSPADHHRPDRGSHDAFAVTTDGVYYMANSIPSASNPTPTWINITGDLRALTYSIFGQSYDPATDLNAKPYALAETLTSIAADWRCRASPTI